MISKNDIERSSAIVSQNGEIIHTLVNIGMIIDIGLNQSKMNSKNTYIAYRSNIDNFFQFTFGCSHNQITPQQIESINGVFVNEYVNYLKEKGNINKTINQKLSTLKQMATWLKKSGYNIEPFVFESFSKLRTNNKNSYEAFNEKEVYSMIKKAKEYSGGELKSLLIRLAFDTAFRKSALLNLKRENFIIKDGKCFVWVYDKGNKKDTKPMSEKLFDYVLTLMDKFPKALLFRSNDDNRIPMSNKSAERLIIKLKKDLEIKGKKKTFHSIKKASINRMERLSNGDLSLMQRHGNHANASTTINHYYKGDKEDEIYYEIVQEYSEPNFELIKKATREEIIEVIELSSARVQFELIANLKKIQGGNKWVKQVKTSSIEHKEVQ